MDVSYAPNREIALLCHGKEERLHKLPFALFCRDKENSNKLYSTSMLHQTTNLSKTKPDIYHSYHRKTKKQIFLDLISLFDMDFSKTWLNNLSTEFIHASENTTTKLTS